jgi:uncharacterized repeat protein (TIGR02543 family)
MKIKKSFFAFLLAFITCIAPAQVSITVNVPTAGGFSASFTSAGGDKATLTNLTVTGNIDARDVKFMRDSLPQLAELNLEAVQIAAYNGSGGTSTKTTSYPANKMPEESFYKSQPGAQIINKTLKKIILPLNLKVIGAYAFQLCEGLTCNLKIPESVTTIENDAYYCCRNLTGDLLFPASVTTIGESAFGACGFTGKLQLPAKNISIGYMAFENCAFTGSLVIPNNYTRLTSIIFQGCSGFTSLILPNNLKTLEYDVFNGCNGFSGELVIPGSVTSIVSSFRGCSGFTSCYIPGSVKTIKASDTYFGAFSKCSGLKKVFVNKDVPLVIDDFTFYEVDFNTCELIVPTGSKATYQEAKGWKLYKNIREALFVTLNTQGGHPAAPVTTTLTNATITEPGNAIREGYSFVGWYKEAACTNAWNFATDLVSAPTTLYAKWIANPENTFTVSFVVDGGTGVTNVVAPANTKIAQPAAPTKADCTFGGWYKEADFKDAWNFETDTVTSQTMLFAKWNTSVTGIEIQQLSRMKIYPNPVSTWISLSNFPSNSEIQILRIDGMLIQYHSVVTTEITFDVSGLPNGIYLLKVKSAEGSRVEKFIKQ